MSRPRFPLTPAVQQQLTSFIRAGGVPEVGAEAAGVPVAVFADWMRRGEGSRAPADCRAFALAVRQAHAQARLAAEITVRDKRPLDWLRYGPGRDSPRAPGWGAAVKPRAAQDEAEPSMESRAIQGVLRDITAAAEPWPEVRAAVAAKINKK